MMLSSTNRWINMPTDVDQSMALLAFSANKAVEFTWDAADVTSCVNGWEHNRSLEGYWIMTK
ncbi:MAG: hypothetical protein MJK04_05705 [Psychrosphaera sp.]|nr:hypothetical protein [Psychrosphaera sp.]